MASRIFLSMFLSSILIILSLFIPVMYLMMNDFWFYSTVLISLFMLHYSFNIIDNTEISDKGKESLSTLSYNSVNKMNIRRSIRVQKKREREAAETLIELSKKNISEI